MYRMHGSEWYVQDGIHNFVMIWLAPELAGLLTRHRLT